MFFRVFLSGNGKQQALQLEKCKRDSGIPEKVV